MAFRGFSSCRLCQGSGVPRRSYFWPFTEVQNGNHREVTTKCGNFFKPKGTKAGKTLFGSLRVKYSSLFSLMKVFGVAFCYKDCSGELPLPFRSAQAHRVGWVTVEAAVPTAKRPVLPKCKATPLPSQVLPQRNRLGCSYDLAKRGLNAADIS